MVLRRAYCCLALGALVSAAVVSACGRPEPAEVEFGEGSGVGVVNGGGGFEDLDSGFAAGADSGTLGALDGGNSDGISDVSSGDAEAPDGGASDGGPGSESDAGDGALPREDGSLGDGGLGADANNGTPASDGGPSDATSGDSMAGSPGVAGDSSIVNSTVDAAGDAATGTLQLTLGGSAHIASLDWTINGPNTYSGSVTIGDAQSVEWIIGGVRAGDGYTLSVTATDTDGDPCQGTSGTFNVQAGIVSTATLTITCGASTSASPADVTTGSVVVQANVIVFDEGGADGDPE